MPITCQEIIDQAATDFGDPTMGRILQAEWLEIYNRSQRSLTRSYRVIEEDAFHDIAANEDRILYPSLCVQLKRWQFTSTPDDPASYVEAGEIFEDEYRAVTRFVIPTGDTGFRYWARLGFIVITPRPTVLVKRGGLMSYWKLAAKVVAGDEATVLLEVPETLEDLLVARMVIKAKSRNHRMTEAQAGLAEWEAEMAKAYEPIEDRSDDRRPRLRLRSAMRGYGGMV